MVLVEKDIKPRDIITLESLDNAMALDMAMGGSTNTVLHSLAVAHEAQVAYDLNRINSIAEECPNICKVSPSSTYHLEDVDAAGGISAILKEISKIKGLVNGALRSLAQIQSRLEQQSFRINEVLKTSPQVEMDLARAESGVEAARITLAKLSSVKQDLDIKQQERVATVWVEEHASGARMIKKPGKFLKVVVGCLVGIFLGLVWSSRTVERKLGELIRREWGAEPCDASEPLAFGEPPANDPPSDDGAGEQT